MQRVLVTHAHGDHAAGAAALVVRWPRAVVAKLPWPERDARYSVALRGLEAEQVRAALATADGTLRITPRMNCWEMTSPR